MTAEVAILNRHAVALAADSAVSVGGRGGQAKVYNSVNKLFGLSKYEPMGVMVYGSADIAGVPWETLIKEFRKDLGATSHNTVGEYFQALLDYMKSRATLFFPPAMEAVEVKNTLNALFRDLATEASKRATKRGEARAGALAAILRLLQQKMSGCPFTSGYSAENADAALAPHEATLAEVRNATFSDLDLGDELTTALRACAVLALTRDHELGNHSGVVVAGFGKADVFPALETRRIYRVMDGLPRAGAPDGYRVGPDGAACLMPFAQRELVSAFMEGVDPDYQGYMETALETIFVEKYPGMLAEAVAEDLGSEAAATLRAKLVEVGRAAFKEFSDGTARNRHERYTQPVIAAVAVLPKDELATLAESLVHLTSLKRRVSLDAETVGGPIDVVVISKGDGLIWMRRKHYFRPELNPHFFTNYFREVQK